MAAKPVVTACVIVIGNEVLSGRTKDVNLNYLAARLNDIGIRLAQARVIPDDEGVIVDVVNECRAAFDYVFTTGGIGPTHDDITSASIAKAFGVELELDDQALELLREHYQDRPESLNEARMKMAHIPRGAVLIDNPVSKAPGFQMENVFVLAGVPMIMEAMFEGIKDRLLGGDAVRSLTVSAFIVEGDLAAALAAIQERSDAEIGSYPFIRNGRLGVSIVIRSPDAEIIGQMADQVRELIRSHGVDPLEHGES